MRIFILLFVLVSFNAVADVSLSLGLGYGNIYEADKSGKSMYSIAAEKGDWRVEIAYWEEYTRTSWYVDHPEWRHAPLTIVKSHTVVSLTNRLYKKSFGPIELFYDFGLSITDRVSSVNSSYLLFKHNIGVRYRDCSAYLSHKSNAGLAGINAGEDGLSVMCSIYFN